MLRIDQGHADEIVAHAIQDDPDECCGILAGKKDAVSRLYRITNTAHSPYRYLMDPQEHLIAELDAERNDWDLLAFYHSHTHGPAYPSQTDLRMAQESGWLDVYYVLVSLQSKDNPEIKAFHITESGDIVEEELRIS